jgi:hypothetical protein
MDEDMERHATECGPPVRIMNALFASDRFYVKKTKEGKGWGLFAREDIPPYSRIITEDYSVMKVESEVYRKQQEAQGEENKPVYHFNARPDLKVMDEFKTNSVKLFEEYTPGSVVIEHKKSKEILIFGKMRFINHSCDPNCKRSVALRGNNRTVKVSNYVPISKGTEITITYNTGCFQHVEYRSQLIKEKMAFSDCKCSLCLNKDEDVEFNRLKLSSYHAYLPVFFNTSNVHYLTKVREEMLECARKTGSNFSMYSNVGYGIITKFNEYFKSFINIANGTIYYEDLQEINKIIEESKKYFEDYNKIFTV